MSDVILTSRALGVFQKICVNSGPDVNVQCKWFPSIPTPPHWHKAFINRNVSKPLMQLNVAPKASTFTISASSPTYAHFIKYSHVGSFLGSCHSTAHCLERRSKIFFSRTESLEVGDESGHQLSKSLSPPVSLGVLLYIERKYWIFKFTWTNKAHMHLWPHTWIYSDIT